MVKAGALVAENADGLTVSSCSFSRLDGNAVILYGFVRNALLEDNEFFSLGANAIVSWGVAEFQEGTRGTNPEGTRIVGNFAHEVGLLEKQGCFYFQALSALAVVDRNVAFNGPRKLRHLLRLVCILTVLSRTGAALNFNDGFGGGAVVRHNCFVNWVRETGDQ